MLLTYKWTCSWRNGRLKKVQADSAPPPALIGLNIKGINLNVEYKVCFKVKLLLFIVLGWTHNGLIIIRFHPTNNFSHRNQTFQNLVDKSGKASWFGLLIICQSIHCWHETWSSFIRGIRAIFLINKSTKLVTIDQWEALKLRP